MALACSITNQPADEPVVSKFGHIYEKRIIEKYLETHEGKCPHTGEQLTAQDLIAVKATKIAKPRPAAATSVPGLLQLMQNEWDALMVETFTLKQQLDVARQEVAQALYQHDASCRVIARLVKERDEARNALANMKAAVGSGGAGTEAAAPTPAVAEAMEGVEASKSGTAGIPAEVRERVTAHAAGLQAKRVKRVISPTLAKADDIAAYKVIGDFPGMHSASTPGVLCVDLSPDQNQVVTGGADKTAIVLDRNSGKEVGKLSGHSGRVLDVAFHPSESLVLTASADSTAIAWTPETKGRKKGFKAAHTFTAHKGEVVGLAVHPLSEFFATAATDGTWALHNIAAGKTFHTFSQAGSYRSLGFHPDGMLLGVGSGEGPLHVWELNTQQNAVSFAGHKGALVSLSFSENGYYLASASADNTVRLWDMRKQSTLVTHTLEGASSVRFDLSGSYLLAGGASGPVVLKTKTLEVVRPAQNEAAVTDVVWGADAAFFATVSTDRSLKFWGK